jgi:hypothetical protein
MDSQKIIDTLNQIIDTQDISVAAIARRMEKSTQALNKQLNNDDMKVSTLLEIIEALHCDVIITITDRATKKEYTI